MLTLCVVFITTGLSTLHGRAIALGQPSDSFRWVYDSKGCASYLIGLVLLLYSLCSIFVVGTFLITPFSGTIPNWIIPTIVGSTLLVGTLYYFMIFWAFASVEETDQERSRTRPTLLRFAGVICKIHKAEYFNTANSKHARRFGSRRKITYKVRLSWVQHDLADVA